MNYVGLTEQIRKNNFRSGLLLTCFPLLLLAGVYLFFFFTMGKETHIHAVNIRFIQTIPFVLIGVGIWFAIAYFANTAFVRMATHARPLERKENMRVYNLTENLCMSVGMRMPNLYIIDSPALNAFASGIDQKSFSVTLTSGIIERLNDRELEGVIAHELTHIRNRDVRLLIISIIFVGIFSFVVQGLFRTLLYGGGGNRRNRNDNGGAAILIAMLIAAAAYLLSVLFKLALSRKREYLADAGAVQLTRNSEGLASALRKISGNSDVSSVKNEDVKQLFIENASISEWFSTHPSIEKRIALLERM